MLNSFKNETATQTGTSLEKRAAAIPCDSGLTSADDKPYDLSLITCDGSCAPGKESPRNKACDEVSDNMTHDRNTETDFKYCNAKPSAVKDAEKFPVDVDSIQKKVEEYVKEHIRPLCKSGVITAEQYPWSVAKTAEKVKRLAEQHIKAAQTRG